MGIKNLNKLLKQHCSQGISKISLRKLQNTTIAIDTSIYLYKYSYFGDALKNFERQICHLLSNKITPVYLFDGKPGAEKDDLIKKRKEQYKKKKENLESMQERIEEIKKEIASMDVTDTILMSCKQEEIDVLSKRIFKLKKSTIRIDREMIKQLKEMLDKAGIYYYQCNGETDIFVKEFFKKRLINYVITEDLDFLTHCCPKVLYGYKASSNSCVLYDYNIIIKELSLNKSQFIDLCIMFGCDYTGTIKGIGKKTAYKFIKQYKTIEEILKNKPKFTADNCDYVLARKTFTCENDIDFGSVRIQKKDLTDLSDNMKNNIRKFHGTAKPIQKNNIRKFFRPKKKV